MSFRSIPQLAILAAVLAVPSVPADEGMWMPQQIPDLAPRLRALGFEGESAAFADLTGHPMGAIVSLGGCTASFVSPDGLIATNHHCIVGSLQYNSTPERNLLEDGFLARDRSEELWNGPGSRVYVTTSVRKVTERIVGDIEPGIGDRERNDTIERRIKELTAACESDGVRCSVASFFGGLDYYEIASMEIRDVRLVYAPSHGLGVFGGETDNFRWPRHTGDWGFYRAYVTEDGKSAPYSESNVPYRPKHWLRVSPAGADPDDLVFVAGYPGSTRRHRTFAEIRETVEWSYPRRIRLAEEQIAILEPLAEEDDELAIKVVSRVRGLSNGLTYRRGVLDGMLEGGVLATREARERELVAWIDADPKRRERFGDILPALDALQADSEKTRDRDASLYSMYFSSSLLGSARTIHRLSIERPKPDLERDEGYQERDWERIRERETRKQRTLDVRIDRALLRHALREAATLPSDQRIPALDRRIGLRPGADATARDKAIDSFLDGLYAGTRLVDPDFRLGLLDKSTEEIVATGDPFIGLAVVLEPLDREIRDRRKERDGALSRLRPRYMEALLAKTGGLTSPDANGTLRLTYGRVVGVPARDGVFYTPQTTLRGLVAKHTGEGDFDAPDNLLAAIEALRNGRSSPYVDPDLDDVPVNFLSNVDTTGGNSGSATLNARGEFCGLVFDGTFESIAADYLYVPTTRSIHVDSRYMLWVMTEVDRAHHLLEEIGVRRR